MKKIILLVLILSAFNVKSQITLEHTYDSASSCASTGPTNQLMIVEFENSGTKYIRINRYDETINVYSMSHILQKSISYSGFPGTNPNSNNIMYISEGLFDLDNSIEFMYSTSTGTNMYYTGIYNEDGSLLFSETGAPMIYINVPLQQYPIYNTPYGTKMILSFPTGQAKVYSLPGILSTSIAEANNVLISAQSSVSNAYPNPAANSTQIDYALPIGESNGFIVFYDLQGNEVKRFEVDDTFSTLLISTSDIAAGTYYYQLQTTATASEGKKMVVIK